MRNILPLGRLSRAQLLMALGAFAAIALLPRAADPCLCGWTVLGELLGHDYRDLRFYDADSLWIAIAVIDSTDWIDEPDWQCSNDDPHSGKRLMIHFRQLEHAIGLNRGPTFWMSTGQVRCSSGASWSSSCDINVGVGDTLAIGTYDPKSWNNLYVCSAMPILGGGIDSRPLEDILRAYRARKM
jgi:hypothetical protein